MADPSAGATADETTDPATLELSYGEALAELEQLLTDLEDADIDVDRLTERVARGAELVRYCQERLAVVSGEVDKVVADLSAINGQAEADDEDLADE